MEHQSITRPEPLPRDVIEYFTEQPEPAEIRLASLAIDAVRSSGWYGYDG